MTVAAEMSQPITALTEANAKRDRIAALRRDIRACRIPLDTILRDRPEELAHWPIIDVIRLGYSKRSVTAVTELGRRAVRDNVNLLIPLGDASQRTLSWVAANARWTHRLGGRGGLALYVAGERS